MTLALIVFAAMAIQDTAAAMKIQLLSAAERHRWLAGYCEAVNDVGAALSVGVGGASIYRYGLTAETFEILGALALAAVLGTVAGDWLDHRLVRAKALRGRATSEP